MTLPPAAEIHTAVPAGGTVWWRRIPVRIWLTAEAVPTSLGSSVSDRETFRQVAYVTRLNAFDAAIEFWQNVMQVGPFYIGDFRLENQLFRGEPVDGTMKVALSFHGEIQLEIIAPTNDAPSPYTDLLDRHSEVPVSGLFHHYLVDTPDYDGTCARLLASGAHDGLRANLSDGRRMSYIDAVDLMGCYVEVIESGANGPLVSFAIMREECATWDGIEPRRSYWELVERAAGLRAYEAD